MDDKIIYDLLNDREICKQRIEQRGEALHTIKEIALEQLRETVAISVYRAQNYQNPGLRPQDIARKSYFEMATALFDRLEAIQKQVAGLAADDWKQSFVAQCGREEPMRRAEWETDWLTLCDGTRFFQDLHQRFQLKVSHLKLKKMIIERMEKEQSNTWVVIEKLLTDALKV
jgi:hypothetical protein